MITTLADCFFNPKNDFFSFLRLSFGVSRGGGKAVKDGSS